MGKGPVAKARRIGRGIAVGLNKGFIVSAVPTKK